MCSCSRKPNVILITFDTTRGDAVGYANGRTDVTPNLDKLAAEGTWFSNAITSQPLTVPAHSTIMTGLYPYKHGVRNNGTYVLEPEHVTLAERLKEAGYATHAIVSSYVLDSQFGLDQGFDGFDDDMSGGPQQKLFMFREIRANQTANKAVAWLRQGRPEKQPFFLWLHFYDPHADYEPPEDIADRFPGERYEGEIAYADRELGRVLAALDESGQRDNTLIVFTSDHGESLGEHGERSHGIFVYDSTIHVPLLFSGKGAKGAGKVDALVRTADIAPTVLDMLGIDAPPVDGASMLPLMNGEKAPARTAYAESMAPRLNFGWSELRTHRTATTKFIDAPDPEVYDLRKDGAERENLYSAGELPPEARPLVAQVRSVARSDPFSQGGHTQAKLDPETRRKLAALGYVWGTDSTPSGPRADPKDRIVHWERFQEAQAAIRRHEYPQALAMVRSVLEVDKDNVVAMASLANVLMKMNAGAEALEVYKRMILLDPQRDTPYLGASRILREARRFEEAEEHARAVIRIQPENPEGYTAVGDVFLEQERFDDAEAMFRQALKVDPHSSAAVSGLGNCLNRAGRLREALAVLRKGREQDPSSQAVIYNLAVVVERQGDLAGAKKLYEESIAIDPNHSMSWNNLGAVHDRQGNRAEAIRCVARARQIDPANAEAAYNLGVLLLAANRPAEAVTHLNDVLKVRPSFVPAAVQRARALTLSGENDVAIRAWQQLTPVAPVAWLHIARIELGRGRNKEAREALRRGLESGGDKIREAAGKDDKLRELLKASGA
ncbi:MAG TPA: sulfatase-like hydrolase/transferase [Thermoanaerobaculia bacterium]|nr:sulfatase-like hydrolase/transferase [Thermoanaerobaculia bacterium]